MNTDNIKNIAPGLFFTVVIGVCVWFFSMQFVFIDPLIASILLGMILRTIIGEKKILMPGIDKLPALLIPPGIILYGANLRFNFETVSILIWLQIFIGIIVVVWIAFTLGRILKIEKATSLLIAVGTAICGASAIMIAKPAVDGKNKDTAIALLVITIWGLTGLFLFPYLADYFAMDVNTKARFFATTLHQTGFVKLAAASVSGACLISAMTIKIARTVTIIPLILVIGSIFHITSYHSPLAPKASINIKIPWYLWLFVCMGIVFTFVPGISSYTPFVNNISSLIWTVAIFAIGLTVDIKDIIRSIGKPLLIALIAWLGLILVFVYAYLNTL